MITVLVLMTFYDENGLHKAGSITKVQESDFNPDYMKKLNPPSPGGSTELSELDDVDISGVEDGEVLKYDAATEKWVNATGGGGSGSVITNIYEDGDGHVESMEIDGTEYEFGTGETTIDLSSIQTDSDGKVESMDINGQNYEFTSVGSVSTGSGDNVRSLSINGSSYNFSDIGNVSYDSNLKVASFEMNDGQDTLEFGTGTASIGNILQATSGKIESFDLTTPDGTDTVEFTTVEDIATDGPNGEVSEATINGTQYAFATGGSVIENISTQGPNGEVDSMDIDGQTYSFATGGGGGGGSSLVVTLTGITGTTVELTTMTANSSISVNSNKTYAEIKAADDIIFKIVDTVQGGSKYTLRPTGMQTLNVAADQSLFFTFSVITPSSDTPKTFKLEVSPWGNMYTFKCVA